MYVSLMEELWKINFFKKTTKKKDKIDICMTDDYDACITYFHFRRLQQILLPLALAYPIRSMSKRLVI